ncbi:MAG: hypothetical protein IKI95_05955 [Clostridia bacterium]|nr:hypothetical protein [Clostridia bacterium]
MKIIDLLNKIANGEELPKKMKIKQWQYNAENENLEYELFDRLFEEDVELNDEVEIIEKKKIPEKLGLCAYEDGGISYSWSISEASLKTKINEIIDYLESKGE